MTVPSCYIFAHTQTAPLATVDAHPSLPPSFPAAMVLPSSHVPSMLITDSPICIFLKKSGVMNGDYWSLECFGNSH